MQSSDSEKLEMLNNLYLEEAVLEGIDLKNFKAGHLRGPGGFLKMLECKASYAVPLYVKYPKKNQNPIIKKLSMGFYNGRSIDSIIKEESLSFGERIKIYNEIQRLNNPEPGHQEKLLSFDRLYSLPSYTHKHVDINCNEFADYDDMFCMIGSSDIPRSREKIEDFLHLHHNYPADLDSVISYLVIKRYI
jgi:hypothetical protein